MQISLNLFDLLSDNLVLLLTRPMLVLGLVIALENPLRLAFELIPLRQSLGIELGSTLRGLEFLERPSGCGVCGLRSLVFVNPGRRVRELVRIILWRGNPELLRDLLRLLLRLILQARVLIDLEVDVNAVSLLVLEVSELLNRE